MSVATKALVIAAIAAGLLVLSVGVDLAFNSSLEVRAAPAGETLQYVGGGSFDERAYPTYSRSSTYQEFEVNASDKVVVEIEFRNAYPWSSTKTFTLTRDGCYDGASVLASMRITAPASGDAAETTELDAGTLLREYGAYYPKPVEAPTAGAQPIYLQVCVGERAVGSANFALKEVAR